jgi:hypothetical protein
MMDAGARLSLKLSKNGRRIDRGCLELWSKVFQNQRDSVQFSAICCNTGKSGIDGRMGVDSVRCRNGEFCGPDEYADRKVLRSKARVASGLVAPVSGSR